MSEVPNKKKTQDPLDIMQDVMELMFWGRPTPEKKEDSKE